MCSTFASPRIGNAYFRDNFDSLKIATWRFANSHDPITRIPVAFLHQKYVKLIRLNVTDQSL